jgi:hypothetical protein
MNTQEKIRKMSKIITEYAGPIAKYMLAAEIKRMGYTERDFPSEKLPRLARKVINETIMDPDWKEICIRRVYREVLKR